jgi:hypothetical protein
MTKPVGQTTKLTPRQVAEVERAGREARKGLFATDEEMSDVWRRFGCGQKSNGGQSNRASG